MTLTELGTVPYSVTVDCVSATVDAPVESLVHRLNKILGTEAQPGRPLPGLGYVRAAELRTPGNVRMALVMWGGQHDKPHVYAIGKEEYDSPALYAALRHAYTGRWSPSRLDLALDLDHPEAFDLVVPHFIAAADRRDMKLSQMGDWHRGKERTLYVGARTSRAYVRIYEFNACHGYGPPCRIELQLRPKSNTRQHIAERTPTELLYSSDVINAVITTLGLDLGCQAEALSPGARPPADLERKLNWLASQALPSMLQILAHVGGDPVGLLDAIMARASEIEAQRALMRSHEPWGEPLYKNTVAGCDTLA
jgi:hypothetical protein